MWPSVAEWASMSTVRMEPCASAGFLSVGNQRLFQNALSGRVAVGDWAHCETAS